MKKILNNKTYLTLLFLWLFLMVMGLFLEWSNFTFLYASIGFSLFFWPTLPIVLFFNRKIEGYHDKWSISYLGLNFFLSSSLVSVYISRVMGSNKFVWLSICGIGLFGLWFFRSISNERRKMDLSYLLGLLVFSVFLGLLVNFEV